MAVLENIQYVAQGRLMTVLPLSCVVPPQKRDGWTREWQTMSVT